MIWNSKDASQPIWCLHTTANWRVLSDWPIRLGKKGELPYFETYGLVEIECLVPNLNGPKLKAPENDIKLTSFTI